MHVPISITWHKSMRFFKVTYLWTASFITDFKTKEYPQQPRGTHAKLIVSDGNWQYYKNKHYNQQKKNWFPCVLNIIIVKYRYTHTQITWCLLMSYNRNDNTHNWTKVNPTWNRQLPKKRWNGVSPKNPLKLKCRWPLTPFLLWYLWLWWLVPRASYTFRLFSTQQ